MTHSFAVLLAASSALLQVACDGDSQPFLEAAEIQSLDIQSLQAVKPEGSLTEIFLNPEEQFQLGLSGRNSAGVTVPLEASDRDWFSTNPSAAVVDDNGLVTAVANGDADIFASVGGLSSSAVEIKVQLATLDSINRIEGSRVIERCQPQDYRAIGNFVTPGGVNSERLLNNARWDVVSANVAGEAVAQSATVSSTNETATVLATETGEQILSVSAGTGTEPGDMTLTVADSLKQILVTPNSARVEVGSTLQFAATGSYLTIDSEGAPAAGEAQANRRLDITNTGEWQITTNPDNASVNNSSIAKGLVTGLRVGTAEIAASCGSLPSIPVSLTVNASTTVTDLSFNLSDPIELTLGSSTRELRVSTGNTYSESNDVSDQVDWDDDRSSAIRTSGNTDGSLNINPNQIGTARVFAEYLDIRKEITVRVSASN